MAYSSDLGLRPATAPFRSAAVASIDAFLWPALLIGGSVAGTLLWACAAPFAALAVAAAATMSLPRAVLVTLGLWLANQATGFLVLGYPWTFDSIAWGFAIGATATVATLAASALLSRLPSQPAILRWAAALIGAYVAYEASSYLVALVLGGEEAFAPAIVWQLAQLNAVWAGGFGVLALARRALVTA
jgi:hypothetical protein